MKKCNKCGANVDNEDAFCIHCGGNEFSIIESEQKICTEEPKRICKRCGAEADETARFCVHCGKGFDEAPRSQVQYAPNNQNVYAQKKNSFKFKGWYIPTILSVILFPISIFVLVPAGATTFLALFITSLPWIIYGIIMFLTYFVKQIKQRKEDVKNGIKRPRNVIFTIFCWLGWLIAFIIYAIATGGDVGDVEMVIPLLIVFVIPAYFIMHIYFAPYLIANSRGHVNETPIFILNILAGWTVLCWIIALVWAFTDATLLDKKKRNQPVLSISHEERLAVIFDLYEKGAITQAEFEERKKLILSDK